MQKLFSLANQWTEFKVIFFSLFFSFLLYISLVLWSCYYTWFCLHFNGTGVIVTLPWSTSYLSLLRDKHNDKSYSRAVLPAVNPRILHLSRLLHYMEISFYDYCNDTHKLMHFEGMTKKFIKTKQNKQKISNDRMMIIQICGISLFQMQEWHYLFFSWEMQNLCIPSFSPLLI